MSHDLTTFCADCRAALGSGMPVGEAVAARLADLLAEPAFVAQTFGDDMPPGKRELFHDPEFGFYVLAHVQEGGKTGTPHSHGSSWAVYGNATGVTRMREYRRVNPPDEDASVLELVDAYDIGPGQTRGYGPGKIHSTGHPRKAWVIRVTGTDLDTIERYRFRKFRDTLIERA